MQRNKYALCECVAGGDILRSFCALSSSLSDLGLKAQLDAGHGARGCTVLTLEKEQSLFFDHGGVGRTTRVTCDVFLYKLK